MQQFIKNFARYPDGSWLCVRPGLWTGPPVIVVTAGTRFAPGTMIGGIDPALLLEAEYLKQQRHQQTAG